MLSLDDIHRALRHPAAPSQPLEIGLVHCLKEAKQEQVQLKLAVKVILLGKFGGNFREL